MSDDKHRARAPSSDDEEDIEVTTDDEPSPAETRAIARRARKKGRLALRIPDDEVSRPLPEPKLEQKSVEKANGEAQPIKPTRIISVNPPAPEPSEAAPTAKRIPSSPPTAPMEWDDEDEEVPTPMLPPVREMQKTQLDSDDIDVPVDEDEPEYRPRTPTIPSNPPPAAGPTISKPPGPPIPADALSSAPQLLDEKPTKPRPMATALIDDDEARGDQSIEEIEPDRSSAPPSVDSGDEIDTTDVVSVQEPKIDVKDVKKGSISLPPKPAPPLPQKLIPLVTPAAGISSPIAPPALSEGLVPRRRARPWWEELFNDDFIRTIPKFSDAQIADEVDFIEDSLGVVKGGALLDLGCGTGRHAIELTRRGYGVVGFDLSLALLARAGEEAQERNQKLNFVQGDMREMTFNDAFDGIYCWGTTFGFFEEEKNLAVVGRVHKALRQGGQFLLDVISRDFAIKQSPSLAWFEGEGCVCMDEMQVDWITSRMRVKRTMMLDDGRSKEIEYSIRVYSLHELGKLLHDSGFRVVEVSGRIQTPGVFFGPESPRTLILAEKR